MRRHGRWTNGAITTSAQIGIARIMAEFDCLTYYRLHPQCNTPNSGYGKYCLFHRRTLMANRWFTLAIRCVNELAPMGIDC